MKELKSIFDCGGMKKGDWFKVKDREYEILFITGSYAYLCRFDHSGYNRFCIYFDEREKYETMN